MDQATIKTRKRILDEAKGAVELGGKVWKVEFDFRRITEFERLSGISVLLVAQLGVALKVDTIIKAAWVLFRQQDPRVTEQRICDWLSKEPRKLAAMTTEIMAALIRSMPEPDAEDLSEDAGHGEPAYPLPETEPAA